MAEASAAPQSVAPRLNHAEQAIQWLLDNRGSGGGDGDPETTAQLQRLFKAIMSGAVASGVGNVDEPWEDTLVYEDGVSMHVTIFGLDGQRAVTCQDGKGFYGRVFSDNEVRWAGTGATYDKSLATEVFDQPDTGYIEQIRDQNHRSLAQAIFGPSGNIGTRTIVQRIADVQSDLNNFADNVEQTVGGLSDDYDAFKQSVNTQITDILGRLSAIETRLDNGGL